MKTEVAKHRPTITLKLATSLDARIATVTGASQWITGPESRAEVHRMRATHDGVLTGIGTVLADDPELTARLDPMPARQPWRIVLDRNGRLPLDSKLIQTTDRAGLIWCTGLDVAAEAPSGGCQVHHHGVGVSKTGPVGLDLHEVLRLLTDTYDIKALMVETGPILATAFLRAGLVDHIAWFRAPLLLGGDGRPVFDSLDVEELSQAWVLHQTDHIRFGRDVLDRFDLSPT
ncbi:RibD family protein [Aquidulcibacter sp.]|uniref:RibD family protein n=1 Tax=Aquidulcibacter sp. TaxID=2052990 RepID=UPI003BA5828E